MKKVFKNKIFWFTFILISIISIVAFYGYSILMDIKGDITEEPQEQTSIVEKEFHTFVLYTDSTDYQRELFTLLEEGFVAEGATEEQIASYVDVYARNYAADYLTLNVKNQEVHRYGGKQFLVDPLKIHYEELDGVADYYLSMEYYVKENPETYEETLPEISGLELTNSATTTFDYYDATQTNAEKVSMPAYTLTYNVSYANPSTDENIFKQYSTVEVVVANWDGQWTVVELRTNMHSGTPTVINMYQ